MKYQRVIISLVLAVVILPLLFLLFTRDTDIKGNKSQRGTGDGIGIIYVEGPIMGDRAGASVFGGSGVSSYTLMEQLREAAEDERIRVVLLRINSPGGSSAASEEIGYEVDRLKQKGKLVVVSMGDVCASGGYWLAAKADKIVANASTMTGSIGVIMQLRNLQELYNKIGVRDDAIKSGPLKDIGSEARPMTKEEREVLQSMVDEIYGEFLQVVAKGRNLKMEEVRKLADGRVFTGKQALELGLVDKIGNFYDAIDVAKDLAEIKGEPELIYYDHKTPWQQILEPINLLDLEQKARLLEIERLLQNDVLGGVK